MTGCKGKDLALKSVFSDYSEEFQNVANFVLQNEYITEVTTESPPLLSGVTYRKHGKLYWIGANEDLDSSEANSVNDLFLNCSIIRVLVIHDEDIVVFQMVSKLGHGKYLIFSERGQEYSDEYTNAVEWISDTWYIAES